MKNLLIFTKRHGTSRIKALETYNGAKNDIFVHGFVHGKFLDSGEFCWISLDRRVGEKPVACRSYRTLLDCAGCERWLRGLYLKMG